MLSRTKVAVLFQTAEQELTCSFSCIYSSTSMFPDQSDPYRLSATFVFLILALVDCVILITNLKGPTVFIVALDVIEEPAETSAHSCIQLHPTHRGAHPVSGVVGADLIVVSL